MNIKTKAAVSAVAAAVIAVGAYWYWSPLLAIQQMQAAAQSGDAPAFNDHVDYTRLRESLKGQFSAMMTKRLGADTNSGDVAKAGAALGSLMGSAIVNQMVDTLVRPETVMQAMKSGHFAPAQKSATDAPTSASEKTKWVTERQGVDRFIAYGGKDADDKSKRIAIVMDRDGFAHWRLTEVRMPDSL